MTDRKPKGSTPVASQGPAKSQPAASNGTSSNNTSDSAPTQSMPKVNAEQSGQDPNKGQPSKPASSGKPAPAAPKTAGEIAAEMSQAPAAPAPPPQQQPQPQQHAPKPSQPPAASAAPADPNSVRTARLRLARVDPWSVMKVAFALSIALAIVTVIAISIVWFVLGAAGVWDAVNSSVATLLSDDASSFDITEYVGYGRVVGFALVVSAVDVVLITAIATLGAFLYNLAASLLGGLELTLAEDS